MGEKKLIQSIERAVALLEIIAREGGSAKLSTIAEKAGIKKTTAHNILATLEALGYVKRGIGDVRYRLGARILNLARIAGDDSILRKRLRPVLEQIAKETSETVYLAVPSGDEVFYLDVVESKRSPRANCLLGRRERLEGSAIGLVFLATMPGLRKRVLATRSDALGRSICEEIDTVARLGYALDLERHQERVNCVAVPYYEGGEVRASIGLSGPSTRLHRDDLNACAWVMLRAVDRAHRMNLRRPSTASEGLVLSHVREDV
ncbi:IclR family transcriptional regulator [Phyllobacterium leguminum]|uniref:IclR family transcriptional regulator n=1 Tax=Phyllobacterium leguminum TaxID=314237 RepID=A0A318T4A7_9HYPH|nr:IclR family transcriptional regulator [Phyllobacterium leguminum]PYE87544.1 IclR family transcriptional regulator [Phyllobacterium leguminum]